jgi:cytochrome c oxidase assembly protein subunit 15
VLSRLRQPVSPTAYRRITMAALVLLTLIIVTGGAVRLTGSGLGCTDWPNCTDNRLVSPNEFHANIEFGNRLLTGAVSIAVVAAVLGSLRRVPRRRDLVLLSWGLVAGVVGQIVLGGIVVLSHLNPWLVQGHFLLSILLVLDALVLTHRAGIPDGAVVRPVVTPALERWGRAMVAMATVVILTGTLVTGAGPHSGENGGTPIERLPLAVHTAARIHGIAVMVLLAITVWVLVEVRRHHPGNAHLTRAATSMMTVVVLQGAIGYTQYFTGVPPLLVSLHILGASLVWVAALMVLLRMRAPVEPPAPGAAESTGAPDRLDRLPLGDLVS